jgi:integrase
MAADGTERAERKRKGEHLFKRGGIWYGWRNVPIVDAEGKRTFRQDKRSLGTPSIVRARAELAAWEAETADPSATVRRAAKLGDAWELHEKDRKALVAAGKRSKASLEFYEMVARAWLLYAGRRLDKVSDAIRDDDLDKARKLKLRDLGGKMALEDFDRAFRDAFVTHRRAQGISENTIAKNLIEMRAALYLAKVAGKWAGDLDLVFPRFETNYRPKRVTMTHDEARRLLAHFDGRGQPHHRAMVAFVLATGAEEAAILGARRVELDLVPIPLHGTKTDDRERSCFVVFDWQRELLDVARAGMDGAGELAFKEWIKSSRDLKKACAAVKVPKVSLHGLRHVFTGWALDDGISEGEVAKALGHGDLRQIMRTYDHRQPDVLQRRAMEQAEARRHMRLRVIEGGRGNAATG